MRAEYIFSYKKKYLAHCCFEEKYILYASQLKLGALVSIVYYQEINV